MRKIMLVYDLILPSVESLLRLKIIWNFVSRQRTVGRTTKSYEWNYFHFGQMFFNLVQTLDITVLRIVMGDFIRYIGRYHFFSYDNRFFHAIYSTYDIYRYPIFFFLILNLCTICIV